MRIEKKPVKILDPDYGRKWTNGNGPGKIDEKEYLSLCEKVKKLEK